MLRAMLRDLRAHRARVAMTLAAIALGVSAVVASWVVSDSTIAMLTGGTEPRDGVDVAVWDREGEPLTGAERDRLAGIEGVSSVSVVDSFHAGLVGPEGKLEGSVTPPELAGAAWDGTGRFVLVDGGAPEADGEVALDRAVADRSGLSVGEDARVRLGDGRMVEYTVVGTFAYRGLAERDESGAWVDPRPAVAFAPGATRGWTATFARAELEVSAGGGRVAEAAGALTDTADAATGARLRERSAGERREAAADLRATLLPFSGIALLVGMFVIANTFRLLVTQRTRYFALLRALGARRVQVRRAVLVEAVALALLGATLGTALGLAAGPAVLLLLRPGEDLMVEVTPMALLVGYAAAVPVTVLAAYGAARRAGSVSPMAALRSEGSGPAGLRRGRHALGAVMLLAGLAAVVATSSPSEATLARVVGLTGTVLGVAGVLVLTPALASGSLGLVARAVRPWAGPAARMGLRNSVRDPRRTASTASAVTVGLVLVCAIATLSATFASLIASTTEANVPEGTTVVEPAAWDQVALVPPPEVPALSDAEVRHVAALPEVDTAMASRDVFAEVVHAGGSTRRVVSAVDPEGLGTALTPRIVEGTGDLDRGVIMARTQAAMLGLGVGDELTLRVEGTEVPTRVAGLYEATEMSASVFFDVADAPPELADRVSRIYVTGSDPLAARSAVQERMEQRPDVAVIGRDALIERDVERQRAGFMIMYAMFALAIAVAVFGVVNTLVLSVRQRTREIGLLRAVGAERATVRRMVWVESLVMCLFGGVVGIVLGIGVGAALQNSMLGQSLWNPTVPIAVIVCALVGLVVVGVLAALWPAHAAARTAPLRAIALE